MDVEDQEKILRERKEIKLRQLPRRWPTEIKPGIFIGRFQAITKDLCIKEKIYTWDSLKRSESKCEKQVFEKMALTPVRLPKVLETWLSLVEVNDSTLTGVSVPYVLFK